MFFKNLLILVFSYGDQKKNTLVLTGFSYHVAALDNSNIRDREQVLVALPNWNFSLSCKIFILIFYSEFNTQNVSWDIISFSDFIYLP